MLIAIQAFLREEFSEENSIFWQKCEQYRKSTDASRRKQLARLIYVDHVAESGADQVNIDSEVRQSVERRLATAPVNLFDDAQRQVYLLMKYDPYPRYLKSHRNAAAVGLLPLAFDELVCESEDCAVDDGDEKERRRWSLLPNWLADRRRRTSIRDEVDVIGGTGGTGQRRQAGVVAGRESSSSGLTRFIKRLSHGDRKVHAPPPPPTSQRRNDISAGRQATPAKPTTPASARLQQQQKHLQESLTATKRHAVDDSRALAARRSTSVLGLNTVGGAVSRKTETVSRSAAQRAIRYR